MSVFGWKSYLGTLLEPLSGSSLLICLLCLKSWNSLQSPAQDGSEQLIHPMAQQGQSPVRLKDVVLPPWQGHLLCVTGLLMGQLGAGLCGVEGVALQGDIMSNNRRGCPTLTSSLITKPQFSHLSNGYIM